MPTVFDPSNYEGQIIQYASDGVTQIGVIRNRVTGVNHLISGRFEMLRQGGCGSGQFQIDTAFADGTTRVGQWIAVYLNASSRVYFGRIESISQESPRGTTLTTHGPVVLLNDRTVGGFNDTRDIRGPALFAEDQNLFANDPDFSNQDFHYCNSYGDLVRLLYTQYIQPLGIGLGVVHDPIPDVPFQSFVFRGQESISLVMRNIAIACHNSSWGVDPYGNFFFMRSNSALSATYQEGVDLESLTRQEDRSLMVNRVYMVGDYVYGTQENGPYFRFQEIFYDPTSYDIHGEKRLEVYLPWIRSRNDALKWKTGFFAKYAQPIVRYSASTKPTVIIPYPWLGYFGVKNKAGTLLTQDVVESIDVDITSDPRFSFSTGAERLQYLEPPEPERWELSADLGDLSGLGSERSNFTGSDQSSDQRSSDEKASSGERDSSDEKASSGERASSDEKASSGEPVSSAVPSSHDSDNLSSHQVDSSDQVLSSDQRASSGVPDSSGDLLSSGGLASSDAPLSSNDSGAGSQPIEGGSEKNTAIVPASWSKSGFTALFVSEAPEVRFDDVLIVNVDQADCAIQIDTKFIEVCAPSTLEVCSCQSNHPIAVGAIASGGKVLVQFPEQVPGRMHRLVIRITGIRRGFSGMRFPDRTLEQYESNERFIQSAYPGAGQCP